MIESRAALAALRSSGRISNGFPVLVELLRPPLHPPELVPEALAELLVPDDGTPKPVPGAPKFLRRMSSGIARSQLQLGGIAWFLIREGILSLRIASESERLSPPSNM